MNEANLESEMGDWENERLSKSLIPYIGKVIRSASMSEDRLYLSFEDGSAIEVYDDGQSCCEHRYMTTDDDVKLLRDQTFKGIIYKIGPETSEDYEVHETAFLEVQTDRGFVTLCTHNEHNGYYGGFTPTVKVLE